MLTFLRCTLVRKYKLRERPIVSCLCASFCMPCSLGQQALHIDLAERGYVHQPCSCEDDVEETLMRPSAGAARTVVPEPGSSGVQPGIELH